MTWFILFGWMGAKCPPQTCCAHTAGKDPCSSATCKSSAMLLGLSGLCAVLTWWSGVQSDGSGGIVHAITDFCLLILELTEILGQNFGWKWWAWMERRAWPVLKWEQRYTKSVNLRHKNCRDSTKNPGFQLCIFPLVSGPGCCFMVSLSRFKIILPSTSVGQVFLQHYSAFQEMLVMVKWLRVLPGKLP